MLKRQAVESEERGRSAEEQKRRVVAQITQVREEMGRILKQKEEAEREAKKREVKQRTMVQKKFITSFLVNFLDQNNSQKVRVEMLDTLSSILEFSEEDKQRIGIHRFRFDESKKEEGFLPEGERQGLGAKFMSFLKG